VTLSPITARIDIGSALESKLSAFRAHATQKPLWPVLEKNVQGEESFHLAASVQPTPLKEETDLFDGITGD
jgi:LmbE family N-acetylglucosaminyl deacetylase